MGGSEWLGIVVPEKTAQLRVPVRSCLITLRPTSMQDGLAEMSVDLIDTLGIPWIHVLFWQSLSTWVLPIVAKMHSRFPGSELDAHYNRDDAESAETRAMFASMAEQIEARFSCGQE